LAIFATIAGLATSLGLGTLQINSGLKYLFDMPQNVTLQLVIIAALAFIYTGTAVTGIERGIMFISNLNLFLACLLSMALFFIGPTMAIVESLMTGLGDYLSNVVNQSFHMAPYGGEYKGWLGGWTLYYWAWWIAWAPFVGSFIARISRGRTIREFVSGVLVVPALGSFTWFAIFGTSGLNLEVTGVAKIAEKVAADISVGVFEVYKYYPLGGVMSVIMVALISTFFITSANSGTFVLSMYSTQGDMNPPKVRMGIWGILMAALAFVLLMSGGLQSLQIASIAAAAPFAVIMVVACWCLWKALVKDEATFAELAD
ncbi:MAG TPA: BCCT family transporter, partial [Aminivibrio sp.]|nr:BCCT family transporter [Aminivibrio sp.]